MKKRTSNNGSDPLTAVSCASQQLQPAGRHASRGVRHGPLGGNSNPAAEASCRPLRRVHKECSTTGGKQDAPRATDRVDVCKLGSWCTPERPSSQHCCGQLSSVTSAARQNRHTWRQADGTEGYFLVPLIMLRKSGKKNEATILSYLHRGSGEEHLNGALPRPAST